MTGKAYRINPDFEDSDDVYYYAESATDGAYFHRLVDGREEASEWSFFNATEISEGVLIEVEVDA